MSDSFQISSPDALAQQLRAAKDSIHALNILRDCYAAHDQMVAKAISTFGIRLACHSGCDLCCFFRVAAKAHEILLIAETITLKCPASAKLELLARVSDSARIARGMTKDEQLATNIRCPLLIDHQCAVYSVRPLGCRRHHAQDIESCKFSYENPKDITRPGSPHVQLLIGIQHIDEVIGHIFAQCSFDHVDYELNMALHEALTTGKARRRWWDRKKVFTLAEQK